MTTVSVPPDKLDSVQVQLVIPDGLLPAKLTLNPEFRMTDDDYYNLCMANPDVRIERAAQ